LFGPNRPFDLGHQIHECCLAIGQIKRANLFSLMSLHRLFCIPAIVYNEFYGRFRSFLRRARRRQYAVFDKQLFNTSFDSRGLSGVPQICSEQVKRRLLCVFPSLVGTLPAGVRAICRGSSSTNDGLECGATPYAFTLTTAFFRH